jgi:hypothetical protein
VRSLSSPPPSPILCRCHRFEAVLEFADQQWSIPKKEIFEAEFGALVHLNFSLHYPHDHLYLMYSRLIKQQTIGH